MTTLASDFTVGGGTITVTDGSGFAEGDHVVIESALRVRDPVGRSCQPGMPNLQRLPVQ